LEDFKPTPGKIEFLHLPSGNGVRVDTAVYSGYEISPYYDSMVAKVIVHAPTRLGAIRKMRSALEELMIEGIITNEQFQYIMMYHPEYIKGNYDTSFLEKHMSELIDWSKSFGIEVEDE
jgi:acetyl-CoA carboxylase biotin carboxylase subunit